MIFFKDTLEHFKHVIVKLIGEKLLVQNYYN